MAAIQQYLIPKKFFRLTNSHRINVGWEQIAVSRGALSNFEFNSGSGQLMACKGDLIPNQSLFLPPAIDRS